MKKRILALIVVIMFFMITPVHAQEINHFYANSDENAKVEDVIHADSAIAGNIVDIIGNIDGIGFIAGNDVKVNGTLEYGFIAGNSINVNGKLNKSIYAAGNQITFSKDANVERDIFAAGDTIILNGKLNRDINVFANKIIIEENAVINGNVKLNTNDVTVKDDAVIKGTLEYNENAKNSISDKATIQKITTYNIQNDNSIDTTELLFSIVNMLVTFLVIAIILPKTISKTEKIYYNKKPSNYVKNTLLGFLILICVPIICLLLVTSSIGKSIGLILAVIFVIALYLSFIYSGYVLGKLLLTKLLKFNTNKYVIGLVGITVLNLLILIPVIGSIISLIAITFGLTTIWNLCIFEDEIENKKENDVIEAKVEEKKKPVSKKSTKSAPKKNTKK